MVSKRRRGNLAPLFFWPTMPMMGKALVVLWLLAAVAAPQDAASMKETAHLAIRTSTSVDPAAPGRKVSLQVDVTPKPKMHVYAPGQEGYIAITLTLDANPAFTAAKAKYPPGEKLYMAALDEMQLVYAKPFRITQDITLKPGRSAAETLAIKGTLRYQACDDKICYLPVTVPVTWTVPAASR